MNELHKAGLIGTKKGTVPPVDSSVPTENLSHLDESLTLESQLLLRIGRRAIYEAAGSPLRHIEAITLAPEIQSKVWTKRFQQVMQAAMRKGQEVLLVEFLDALKENKLNIPETILPDLLSAIHPEKRKSLRPLIGERGCWLAQFNLEWQWVLEQGIDQDVDAKILEENWNEGTLAVRCEALQQIRLTNPEEGRTWLQECFKKEKADVRKQLLEQLATNLSQQDEEFLTTVLSDRSKLVKQVASLLLSQIPTSEISARHRQRASELLERSSATQSPLQLRTHPPQELPKEWESDGIPAKSPGGQGKRAFWTEELVSRIRTEFWTENFGASPRELINAILQDDFSHAVIAGWSRAVSLGDDTDAFEWGEPLWKYWSAMTQHPHAVVQDQSIKMLESLARRMDQPLLERSILNLVQDQPDPTNAPITQLIQFLPSPWSSSFAKEYLRITRRLVGSRTDRAVISWLESLPEAAVALPKNSFEAAQAPWQIRDQGVHSWQVSEIERLVALFEERMKLRTIFYEEVSEINS